MLGVNRYVGKRLLLLVPSLLGAATLIFVLVRAVPGDYVDAVLADPSTAGSSREEVAERAAQLRQQIGLNDPFPIQYARWMAGLVRGDLGYSLSQRRPAWNAVGERLGPTAEIAAIALVAGCAWSIPAGIFAAVDRKSVLGLSTRLVGVFLLSLPPFWMGIVFLFLVLSLIHTGPPLTYAPPWIDPAANAKMVAGPSLVLALYLGAPVSRLVRSRLLEVLAEDFLRTAVAKGLAFDLVITRHALRNAAIPVLTLLGTQLGRLIGGVVVVEAVFNVPGMGTGLLAAVSHRDNDLVGAFLLVMAASLLVLNLGIDLLYTAIDPRVRSV